MLKKIKVEISRDFVTFGLWENNQSLLKIVEESKLKSLDIDFDLDQTGFCPTALIFQQFERYLYIIILNRCKIWVTMMLYFDC